MTEIKIDTSKHSDDVQKRLKYLMGPITGILTPNFFKTYTKFDSLTSFLNAIGCKPIDDYPKFEKGLFDTQINEHTPFHNWNELLNAAINYQLDK